VNEATTDMQAEAEKPEDEENDNDCPQHGYVTPEFERQNHVALAAAGCLPAFFWYEAT